MTSRKKTSISENLEELEKLLAWFENDEITVEESLAKYERAAEIYEELEGQLDQAKNQVEVIKKKFSS